MDPDMTKTDVGKMKKSALVRPVFKVKMIEQKYKFMFSELNIISIIFSNVQS